MFGGRQSRDEWGAPEGRPRNHSGSGCPVLTHHGSSDAQRKIQRRIGLEDEMDAAFAQYVEVQGNAGTLAVDREQPVQRITGQHSALDGRGLACRVAAANRWP